MSQQKLDWFDELTKCVADYLKRNNISQSELVLNSLTGDAGFRRYFRVNTTPSLIAVYAPPETEKNELFCQIGEHLCDSGVRVPKVLFADLDKGYLIQEDFGDELLLNSLSSSSVDSLYEQAFETLTLLQSVDPDKSIFESYSKELLNDETALFNDWYLERLLKLELSNSEKALISKLGASLTETALLQEQVLVHRDFHSRNLMLISDQDIGLIDFQDAVIGPITYDLVSLLKDCYIRWDRERVERWALKYLEKLQSFGKLHDLSKAAFLRDFHFMGLQRHLKVLGIFSRLSLRDDKHGYLNDLPRVLAYVLEVTARYKELEAFDAFLKKRVLPAAKQSGWCE